MATTTTYVERARKAQPDTLDPYSKKMFGDNRPSGSSSGTTSILTAAAASNPVKVASADAGATSPYSMFDDTYAKALEQIQGKRTSAETEKAENEKTLADTLTETNRGYNIAYNNAVNPFGYNAEQRGVMGTGVSDYFKNAAYGNFLQGVGKSQQTYQQSVNDINSDFNNFLLELSGLENTALTTKQSSYLSQQQYDAEQTRLAAEAAEQKRQYDESLAEQKRQFDANYALEQQQYADALEAANAAASGGGGGDDGLNLEETTTPSLASGMSRADKDKIFNTTIKPKVTAAIAKNNSKGTTSTTKTTTKAATKAATKATTTPKLIVGGSTGGAIKPSTKRSNVK